MNEITAISYYPKDRINGVELFRLVSIMAVIIIHTRPLSATILSHTSIDLSIIINQLSRFAVPFFFTASGYFWSEKFNQQSKSLGASFKIIKKLFFLFLVWSLLYLLEPDYRGPSDFGILTNIKSSTWKFFSFAKHPLDFALEGTKSHLWFLPSLMICITLSSIFLYFEKRVFLICIAVILYCVGLSGKAYALTPLGFITDFNFRDGPFFGLIFFVSGYWMQKIGPSPGWVKVGITVATTGAALSLVEVFILNRYWGTTMRQDFVASTYLFGIGTTMIAFSLKINLPVFAKKTASMVMGIYAVHYFFVTLFVEIFPNLSVTAIGSILLVCIVMIASVISVLFMARLPYVRRLVS